jgi:hypothetical protein
MWKFCPHGGSVGQRGGLSEGKTSTAAGNESQLNLAGEIRQSRQ